MTFQVAAKLAQLQQFRDRHKAVFRPGGVQQRRGMAFGENETVIVMKMGILGIIFHVAEEQRGDNIRRRTARGRVSAARRRRGFNGMNAQLVGDSF